MVSLQLNSLLILLPIHKRWVSKSFSFPCGARKVFLKTLWVWGVLIDNPLNGKGCTIYRSLGDKPFSIWVALLWDSTLKHAQGPLVCLPSFFMVLREHFTATLLVSSLYHFFLKLITTFYPGFDLLDVVY